MIYKVITALVVVLGLAAVALSTQVNVTVQNFSFTPSNVTIVPSDTVQWTKAANAGTHNVHHNATPSLFGNAISGAAWVYSVRFDTIAADTVAPIGTYNYFCQVHGATMSGNVFVRSIWVSAPAAGASWDVGTNQTISWSSGNVTGNVSVELNRDYPSGGWETLFANTANDGTESWTVAGAGTSNARIRVTSVDFPSVSDVSCCPLAIVASSITVSMPNGGEVWSVGSQQSITWSSAGVTGDVTIELNRDWEGGRDWEVIAANTANDGSELWSVTGPGTTTCLVRIYSVSQPSLGDSSNAFFTIQGLPASISVISPNGGEFWYENNAHALTWTSSGIPGEILVELNRDFQGGGEWETLFAFTPNDGTEDWVVSGPVTTSARVRLTSIDQPDLTDMSDADFTITALAAPEELTIMPSGLDVILRWLPVGDATGYAVYRSPTGTGEDYEMIGTTTELIFTDVDALLLQNRSLYQVTAVLGEGFRAVPQPPRD